MLDSNYYRDQIDTVRAGLRNRGLDPDAALARLGELDIERRRLIQEAGQLGFVRSQGPLTCR